jgi:hypothetical protein
LQYGFLAEIESERFHVADEASLIVANGRQAFS